MIKNYLKTAWRSLLKNRAFSIINIFGLSVGLTCSILILIFVYDELGYDKYPHNAGNIYRVMLSVTGNGDIAAYPDVDNAVAKGMQNEFPEIKSSARLSPAADFVKYNERQFKEEHLCFADANFFQFFSIPLIAGSVNDVLVQPNTIAVSQSFAKKYFGNDDPIGKSIAVGLRGAIYKVTGVYSKIPDNSHFHFDAIMSIATFHITHPTWSNLGWYTYLRLNDHTDPRKLEAKFPDLVRKHVVPEIQHDMGVSLVEAQKSVNSFIFILQPLSDIHLYSHTKYELEANGDIQYVYIFTILAMAILLLACVNFTNLSTARASKRAKEVGIRKVMGSAKLQLVLQFLAESILITMLAMMLAIALMLFLIPYFNQLSGKQIGAEIFFHPKFILAIFAVTIVVGTVAGIYPSFFLSSFSPIKVLKNVIIPGGHRAFLRSGLIVFQFFVSIALIIATLIIYQQMNYIRNKKLGYEKEQVLYIPDGRLLKANQPAFKQELLEDAGISAVSISRSVPGDEFMDGTEIFPKNETGNGTEIHSNIFHVDYDYVRALRLKIIEGRNLSPDFPSDSGAIIINESAVRDLGWKNENAVGKIIVRSGQQQLRVVGVVQDFNYASAKQKIAPLMLMLGNNFGGLIVKMKTADVSGLLGRMKDQWNAFHPDGPFNYIFLDDKFASLYAGERKAQQIFTVFSVISILIAVLGLFGLSAYVVEQRTKEIGIRKVLGASGQQLLLLVTKDFLLLIGIAFLLSIPVSWWAMNKWLQDFAYRINIPWWTFVMSGAIAIFIAILTISYQAIKAAMANPVKSLRTE